MDESQSSAVDLVRVDVRRYLETSPRYGATPSGNTSSSLVQRQPTDSRLRQIQGGAGIGLQEVQHPTRAVDLYI